MSLLLDALKRAEQEKLARHGERAEAEPAPAVAPASPPPAPPPAAPSLELQPLSTPAGKGGSSAQAAAQTVFQAKAANAANEPRNRSMLLGTAVGAVLIVVIAAGAYVWHTIRTLSPQQPIAAARARPPAAPVPVPAGAPPQLESTASSAAFPTGDALARAPIEPAKPAVPVAPSTPPAEPAQVSVVEPPPGPAAARKRLVEEVLKESATQPAPPPLRLERSEEGQRVPRDVAAGYEALLRGELTPARRSYQAALAADPSSVDALLGMATVEAQSGNRAAASAHYRRVLDVDPRNVTAMAGLAALSDLSRPEALEVQLREDLTRYPASAPLRFALGNLYASQRRWTEAQAEFFESYRLDPNVADVLYNLAVSLDHLGQPRLAADFYRRALEASRTQTTQFDPAPVARRLAELRP